MVDERGPQRSVTAETTTPPGDGGSALFAASVGPTAIVLRWASVGFGLVAIAPATSDAGWTDVALLALCVFLTTFRTMMPLRLGASDRLGSLAPVADVAVFSVAVGWSGATESPWLLCLLTAVGIAAYGWGRRTALVAGATAVAVVTATMQITGAAFQSRFDDTGDLLATAGLALAAAGGMFMRSRIEEAAQVVARSGGELARLRSANALLEQLTDVALTLPGAFTMREVLERTRSLLRNHVEPRTTVLVTHDERTGEWTPKITDGVSMRAAYEREELPTVLQRALAQGRTVTVTAPERTDGDDPGFIAAGSGSGVYLVLYARGQIIGLLALEHPATDHFADADAVLREGLADVIALSIDNARWFARLRNLGAEDERLRVARDVHDRLGQWMTYLKIELERLSNADRVAPEELRRLHDDAAFALDELRETLRQLRSGVSDDRPLAVLGVELVERFAERGHVSARFVAHNPDQRLPVPMENEVLRILQEALNNVDRHAGAKHVDVDWMVEGGNYELLVSDDGRGFDAAAAVREQSYGVVGMRERADVIGAALEIASSPGGGTRLSVRAGSRVTAVDRPAYPGPNAPEERPVRS